MLGLSACTSISSPQKSDEVQVPPAAHAIVPGFLTDDSKYASVENTDDDRFAAVGALVTSEIKILGSAVLIHPRAILTAAHCFSLSENQPKYFLTQSGQLVPITKVFLHPAYWNMGIENDIAICILDTSCYEPPVELMREPSELRVNEGLVTVGWSLGYKKISKLNVMKYYGSLIEDHGCIMRMLATNGSVFFGDSGGAVFEDHGKLCGIIGFFQIDPDAKCITDNGAARVDYHYKWIDEKLCLEFSDWPWFEKP